jgi:uncharacterized protein (TIGR00730 family)
MNVHRVCVYCASSSKIDDVYFAAVERLGVELARNGVVTVFGGGGVGLMGRLADTILREGGRIVGVMPAFMKAVEFHHPGVAEFHVVDDMHQRKKMLIDGADAVIALPGGCGTLEELLEVVTLKRLGIFLKPIVIVNVAGFYDPLLQMLDRCIAERFMAERHRSIWTTVDRPEDVLPAIADTPPWRGDALAFAAV